MHNVAINAIHALSAHEPTTAFSMASELRAQIVEQIVSADDATKVSLERDLYRLQSVSNGMINNTQVGDGLVDRPLTRRLAARLG